LKYKNYANEYLEKYDLKDKTVLGVWSHTLARSTKAQCITVRNNYLNYVNPIRQYKPTIVMAEHNEADSDNAYLKQNIVLDKLADSVVTFDVWRYKIKLFWMKPLK
jgi:hypothetical protein